MLEGRVFQTNIKMVVRAMVSSVAIHIHTLSAAHTYQTHPPPAAGVVQIQKTARVPGRHLDHIRAKSPAKPTVILLQPRHPHRHQ